MAIDSLTLVRWSYERFPRLIHSIFAYNTEWAVTGRRQLETFLILGSSSEHLVLQPNNGMENGIIGFAGAIVAVAGFTGEREIPGEWE